MVAVIPAYEPDFVLTDLVRQLKNANFSVVVVDDGSSPEKAILFQQLQEIAVVLHHGRNLGKGRALKTAFAYIREHLPEEQGIVTVDADGQHTLADICHMREQFQRDPNRLFLGVRKFTGKIPWKSRWGNAITKAVFALSSGKLLSDTQTGLRAFPTAWIPFFLRVDGERYEYEMNALLQSAESGIPWQEVPIRTVYFDAKNSVSHFQPLRDSVRIYRSIFKFSGSSLLSFLLDYVLFNLLALAVPVVVSNVLARVVSCIANYKLNQKFVFHDSHRGTAWQYFLLAAGILLANTLLLEELTEMGVPAFAAKVLVEITLFFCSMLVQRFWIFPISHHQKEV